MKLFRSLLYTTFGALALYAGATFAQSPETTPETTPDDDPRLQVLALDALIALLPPAVPASRALESEPPVIVPEVLERYPHDPASFTQGLEWAGDRLIESIGQYGQSQIREVDLETGDLVRGVSLPAEIFAEGLTRVDDRFIQLSWREGVAPVWDAETFALDEVFVYRTEGWGLCYDGEYLWHSDGSGTLTRRDPATFAETGFIAVSRAGLPVTRLNELECAQGRILANVWYSDDILVIDPATGVVTAVIDGSALLPADERATLGDDAVLNGIAYRAETDTYFLTGKLWPALFEVRLDLP